MRPRSRLTGRAVLVVVLALACGCALAACKGSPRPAPPDEVVFIGVWDRTKPMMEEMAADLRMRIRAYTPKDSDDPGFAARIGAPKLLFVLNAPIEKTATYEQLIRAAKAAGTRVIALDARDWQAAMVKAGLIALIGGRELALRTLPVMGLGLLLGLTALLLV